MAIGVCEVDAPPAVVVIDLAGAPLAGVGPVLNAALTNPAKDRIKVIFVDQKSIVMGCNIAFDLIEIERRTVVEVNRLKGAEARRRGQAENVCQKCRRTLFVAAPDDGVVESNAHVHAPFPADKVRAR